MCGISRTSRLAAFCGISVAVLALSTELASADSLVVVSLAGEAFDGPPTFDLMIGDKVVGSGTLSKAILTETDGRLFTKPRPSQFLEQFAFRVPDDSILPGEEISIALTNDKFLDHAGAGKAGIFDRNLFVDFVSVNGLEVTSADLALLRAGEVQHLDYQAGLLPIYEAGYRVVAKPPADGWPIPGGPVSATSVSAVTSSVQPPVPLLASWTKRLLEQADR